MTWNQATMQSKRYILGEKIRILILLNEDYVFDFPLKNSMFDFVTERIEFKKINFNRVNFN